MKKQIDDDDILKDGERMTVRMPMMDAAGRELAERARRAFDDGAHLVLKNADPAVHARAPRDGGPDLAHPEPEHQRG